MKVVIIRQKDLKDCGCCCLQSIIKYYHGFVHLETIRKDTFTDHGGTSAYHLINAAKNYGFDGYGKRVSKNNLAKEYFPAIAHVQLKNGLSHYVVIYKVIKDKIIIMDPTKGKIIMKLTEFFDIWTNILIVFHPRNKIINYPKPIKITFLFLKYLKKYQKKYYIFILLNLILTIVTIISGFFLSTGLICINNISLLIKCIITYFTIIVLKIYISFMRGKMENKLNYNLSVSLLSDYIKHLFKLPLNIFQSRTSGEIMTRINELNETKSLFTELFVSLFLDSILIIISLIILLLIDKLLAFIVIITSLVYFIISLFYSKLIYVKIEDIIEKDSLFNSNLLEFIGMYESIKNLNYTEQMMSKLKNKLHDLSNHNYLFSKTLNIINCVKSTFLELCIFAINAIGLYYIHKGAMNIITLIAFNSIISFYIESFENLVNIMPKYYYLKASFEKISEFYNLKEEKTKKLNISLKKGNINFKNVTISYDNYHKIISNFNATIKNKAHVLLVGKSGSGKSTILKTLLLNSPYNGVIKINDLNLQDYDLYELRKSIRYIGQNENIFTDTIYNNITCFNKVSISKFYQICKICMIDEIIKNKPLRYMSIITNDLINLSGGEKQRIILARALINDAVIYIFDEALSEIDYDTEIKIIKNIKEFLVDKTIIYVSHKDVKNQFKDIINLSNT